MKLAWSLICCLLIAVDSALPQVATKDQVGEQHIRVQEYWVDPFSGLMWAGKDSGKDLSWKKAIKYCRDLRLAGYADWRLPRVSELQSIYDASAEAPGLAGPHSQEPTTWHVKGRLFLTALEWSGDGALGDRGHPSAYKFYFDFNDGKADEDPTGWPYPFQFRRALCVRGSGAPITGRGEH